MRRALALLLALLLPAVAAAGEAGALRTEDGVVARDAAATGAMVWLHPHYTEGPPPTAPAFMARLAAAGWDLWRYDRPPGGSFPPPETPPTAPAGPLGMGVEALAEGTAALRARGYRRVVLVGESRGAFIMLAALRVPALADGMVLAAPAAHGRRPERRPQALADFAAALDSASPLATRRIALLLFDDDGWDPDPAARAALFRAAMQRLGMTALLIDRPAEPTGHGGVQGPAFDARFGGCLATLFDFDRPPPPACP
jgi:pimeloyl-ACP methyl ester carboxylesterase